MRRHVSVLLLFVTGAVAHASGTVAVNFAQWDRQLWLPVHESYVPVINLFAQQKGYIENPIPPGAAEKDIVGCAGGLGLAFMLLKDFRAADLVARAEMAFDRKGAPAIFFRTQREGVVTGLSYSLVIYEKGVNFWQYDGKKWGKVAFTRFDLAPGAFHDLMVEARGEHFVVHVDGQLKLECDDPAALPAGDIGLWAGEGPCRIKSFAARPLAQP